MSQVDVDSGIENMEVDENDRREKRSLTDKVSLGCAAWNLEEGWTQLSPYINIHISCINFLIHSRPEETF